jgi:membrane-associated phospholipid phosphatase
MTRAKPRTGPRARPRIVNPAALRASAAALGAFGLVAQLDEPTLLDREVYDWARRNYGRRIELAQWPIELFGLPGVYIPAALLVGRELGTRGKAGGGTVTAGALAGWAAVRLSRLVIHRPRPPRPRGRHSKSESTFPSGHTTGVTAMALVAASVLHDEQMLTAGQALLLALGLPLVTGLNRVYVREHWLTDVLGGLTLGLSAGLAILATRRA